MPVSDGEVRTEFKKAVEQNPAFNKLLQTEPLLQKVSAVSVLLGGGPDKVDPGLKMLNGMLEAKVGVDNVDPAKKYLAAREQFWAGEKDRSIKLKKSIDCAKLLTSVLFEIEEKAGFTHQTPPSAFSVATSKWSTMPLSKEKDTPPAPYMAGVAKWTTFQSQLYSKEHWKDVGVPPTHGEFTHRIQWAIVSLGKVVPNPGELMRELSNYPPTDKQASALWDAMFDRLRAGATNGLFSAVDDSDFRSPEQFNAYICSDGTLKKFPLLSAFLRARKAKREGKLALMDYASLKAFGRPFDKLNEKEQQTMMAIMEDRSKGDAMIRQKVKV